MRKFLIGMFMTCALAFVPCIAGPLEDLNGMKITMGETLTNLTALDDADKKIKQSDDDQIFVLAALNKIEARIINEDLPALQARANEADAVRQSIIDSGCPEGGGEVEASLAARCNALIDAHSVLVDGIVRDMEGLKSQMNTVVEGKQAVSETTMKNFAARKENDYQRGQLEQKKLQLQFDMVRKALEIPGRVAKASQVCASISDPYTAHCCLSVINDNKNPRDCGSEVIYNRFMQGGIFSN
jgi:hypothetical protein